MDTIRMIEQTMSFSKIIEFGSIHAFTSSDDARHWSFLPLRPDLQRGEDGRPLFSFYELGSYAQLTFSTLWQADPDDLLALAELLGRTEAAPPDLQLGFAPLESPRCHVLIGDDIGGFASLGYSDTSGYPPYQALFNLTLAESQQVHARAALRGEKGHLKIEYAAEMLLPEPGAARLSVDAARLLTWLAELGIGAELHSGVIEQAIEQGLIRIEIQSDGYQSAVWRRQMLDLATHMLPAWLSSDNADAFELSLARHVARPAPLRFSIDLGELLAPASS
jgi:hypothetical protein